MPQSSLVATRPGLNYHSRIWLITILSNFETKIAARRGFEKKTDSWLFSVIKHLSVTHPVEPDQGDYFPLPFSSDCTVWLIIPSVFLQTNKQTKNKNKNKTTATTKVKSYTKFYQQFYREVNQFVLVGSWAWWWPSHSKTYRNCQQKALRRGFLHATNGN